MPRMGEAVLVPAHAMGLEAHTGGAGRGRWDVGLDRH